MEEPTPGASARPPSPSPPSASLTSLRITRVPASGATQPFRWNPFGEITGSTRHLLHDKPLWLAVLGVSYFWFAGVLLKTDLQYFGKDALRADDNGVSLLWAFLAIGIGAGNMLAGRLSGDKVELGLVPMGAALMGFFALALVAARHSFLLSTLAVVFLAMASGLFVVPLYAYIQQRSDAREKGRVVAANNFYQTIGMLIASGLMWLCYTRLHLSAATIMLAFGVSLLLVTVYIVTVVPDYLVRFVLWLLTHSIFRIRIHGQENVPFEGPALLVANHMSHVDGFLVGACVQRFIRFMVWKPYYDMKAFHWLLRRTYAIPVGKQPPRQGGIHPRRPPRTRRRPHRLHLRRGRHQPHRQHAALQTRHGKDRRWHRRAHHSRASRSPVGQHLQLRQRQILLEVAHADPLPRDRHFRRAAALRHQRAGRPPGHPGTLRRPPPRFANGPADLLDRRLIQVARRNWTNSPWPTPPAAP